MKNKTSKRLINKSTLNEHKMANVRNSNDYVASDSNEYEKITPTQNLHIYYEVENRVIQNELVESNLETDRSQQNTCEYFSFSINIWH